jgi:copper chaperone CopZ
MRTAWLFAVAGVLAGLLMSEVVEAAGSRVALILTGEGCEGQREVIEVALKKLPGVAAVDFRSVPGHALVDVEAGMATVDQLVEAVKRVEMTGATCAAEEMKSCITAEAVKPSRF